MRASVRDSRRRLGSRGSSMIYVIFMIALLSVFSCGYMAVSRFNMRAAITANLYMEAQLTAKTIHTSFSEAVSSGDSSAMNCLWDRFEEDIQMVREEYDEMVSEEEELDMAEADIGDEDGTQSIRNPVSEPDNETRESEENQRFERYLRQALGNKEYIINGTSIADDSLNVEITLKAAPLEKTAYVHTKVMCNGYRFSMKADIVFDNSDGAVMTISRPGRRSSAGGFTVYLEGNGVYRYYEDED